MLAVGDEGERARPPAGPDEEEAEHEVDQARRDHDGEARPEPVDSTPRIRLCATSYMMSTAAKAMSPPSNAAEKNSIFPWP